MSMKNSRQYDYEKQQQKTASAAINVAQLVKIIAYDPAKMTVDVQPISKRRGIVVECNPTSNVLIGTFETYEKHPIFRFYDSRLNLIRGVSHQDQKLYLFIDHRPHRVVGNFFIIATRNQNNFLGI